MTTRALPPWDTWSVWQTGGGVSEQRIERLFGTRDFRKWSPELRVMSGKAGQQFSAYIIGRHGNEETARKNFPSFYPRIDAQKAMLLKADDGTWFPVLTWGPDGWLPLSQDQSLALVRQLNPPEMSAPSNIPLEGGTKGGKGSGGKAPAPPAPPKEPTASQVNQALEQVGARPAGGFADENSVALKVEQAQSHPAVAMGTKAVKFVGSVAAGFAAKELLGWAWENLRPKPPV
jgi:hypothetical protein